ncbi:MAG: hypothetical protein LC105_01150 [Chitinophagales bacterium]|nr:hypothetical protein [Chitinophagales bacterium]
MTKIILLILGLNIYALGYGQNGMYNLLYCIPNYGSLTDYDPIKLYDFGRNDFTYFPHAIINKTEASMCGNNEDNEFDMIYGSFFIFFEPENSIIESISKGVIINPFIPDSDEYNYNYRTNIRSRLENYYVGNFCVEYPYYIYQQNNKHNIYGLHFSISLFNSELIEYLPYYPLGMTIIPLKFYGELSVCNKIDFPMPNWNRMDQNDPIEVYFDSVPIYLISRYDSMIFFEARKAISNKSRMYMEVCSNLEFIYSNSYVRKLVRNYNRIGRRREEYNKTIFETSKKLKDYFCYD